MTKAEKYLWQELRKKNLSGFRFRRQYSIGGFVVDFYCPKVKLAIEEKLFKLVAPAVETGELPNDSEAEGVKR